MSKQQLLKEEVLKAARGGKITCARLRKIAEETSVSYKAAGNIADELKIKIKNCDLGCF